MAREFNSLFRRTRPTPTAPEGRPSWRSCPRCCSSKPFDPISHTFHRSKWMARRSPRFRGWQDIDYDDQVRRIRGPSPAWQKSWSLALGVGRAFPPLPERIPMAYLGRWRLQLGAQMSSFCSRFSVRRRSLPKSAMSPKRLSTAPSNVSFAIPPARFRNHGKSGKLARNGKAQTA